MKAVENFLDKSLYDFVTFKLRPPLIIWALTFANFRAFQVIQQDSFEHTFHVCCWIHPIVEMMGPAPKRSELSGSSKVLLGVIQLFYLIWFDFNGLSMMEMFHNNDGNVTRYMLHHSFQLVKSSDSAFPFCNFLPHPDLIPTSSLTGIEERGKLANFTDISEIFHLWHLRPVHPLLSKNWQISYYQLPEISQRKVYQKVILNLIN